MAHLQVMILQVQMLQLVVMLQLQATQLYKVLQLQYSSNTLDVADINITIADGAANALAANLAGLTVDGAGATFTYTSADDRWNLKQRFKCCYSIWQRSR